MFLKLAGYFSVACGVLWLWRPEMLRGWLHWKAGGKLFWLAMGAIFLPLFHLGAKSGLAGIIGLLVVVFLARQMISAFLREALAKVPVDAFRVVGLLSLLSGIVLIYRN